LNHKLNPSDFAFCMENTRRYEMSVNPKPQTIDSVFANRRYYIDLLFIFRSFPAILQIVKIKIEPFLFLTAENFNKKQV